MNIDRDEARELAREELLNPSYDEDEPLFSRIGNWVLEQLDGLTDAASGAVPGSVGVSVIVAIVLIVATIVVLRAGPMASSVAHRKRTVFGTDKQAAAEYRAAAEAAAVDGDWHEAAVQRFRAIVATVEERGILNESPGLTADEAARDAGSELPDLAERLRDAATLFDETLYGDHAADGSGYAMLRDLDYDVQHARPSSQHTTDAPTDLVAPR